MDGDVDTIGGQWCAIHADTLQAKRIGPIGATRTNYFDRAMDEASRRNNALGVRFVAPNPLDNEAEAHQVGLNIAGLLHLKKIRRGPDAGRYRTFWGTKTPVGLARTVARIMKGDPL